MNLNSLKLKVKTLNFTAKSIGVMFIFTSLANFINFVYHVIMGRLLGPSEYGVLASVLSFLFIAGAIAVTIETTSAKYASTYLAECNVIKIKSFFYSITKRILFFTIIIFIVILLFLNRFMTFLKIDSAFPLIFLGFMIIENSLIAIGRGTIQGMKKFKSLGINLLLEAIIKLGLGVILVYFGLKASGAILGFMLATLFSYLFIFFPLGSVLKEKEIENTANRIDIKKFYKDIFLILISTVLISVFSYTDIILVKHFFSSYETGYYSAAAQIGRIVLFFPGAVGLVIFPRFSEKFAKKERNQGTLIKSLAIVFIISIFFLIFYFLWPELIVRLIYGSVYLDAAGLIFKYGIFMAFVSLIYIQVYYFISIEKYWYLIYFFLIIIEQIILIWIFNDSMNSILLILMANSAVLFLLNILLIFINNKGLKRTVLEK
jgi:O-antigen/teichoic acid export membrane protein